MTKTERDKNEVDTCMMIDQLKPLRLKNHRVRKGGVSSAWTLKSKQMIEIIIIIIIIKENRYIRCNYNDNSSINQKLKHKKEYVQKEKNKK